ncbi:MAG: hypothetical protein HOQ29_00185 [Acidobacteria bacterium]|nr:hypothetical protein [Acidobacteriota bacterium]
MGVLLAAAIAVAGGACSKGKKEMASETQVSGDVRTPDAPMTVAGCLRAGEASDTFVLTQDAATTGTTATANYQLVGVDGVNLRDHIGERVQVSGVLASQQEVASRSTPSQQDKATGTAGTPTVQTQTRVDMRTLRVNSLNPQGAKCETR